METGNEEVGLQNYLLESSQSLRAWLSPENEYWAGFSSLFALILFVIWTIRYRFSITEWVLLVDMFTIGILISLRTSKYHFLTRNSPDSYQIVFMRSGVAWKKITDALIGLAIISSTFVYLFSNALPSNPEIVLFIYDITLILHCFILPTIPAISKIKSLPILKSKIFLSYNGERITDVTFEPHPLDLHMIDENTIKEEIFTSYT